MGPKTIRWRGKAEKVRVITNFSGRTQGADMEKLPDCDLWQLEVSLEPGAYKYFFEVDGEFEMDEKGQNIKCNKLEIEDTEDVVYLGCSHTFVHGKELPINRSPADNQLCPSCSLAASFHQLNAEIKTEKLSPLQEEENNLVCSGCNLAFDTDNDLLAHQKGVFYCSVCQTTLSCLEELEKHDAMHTAPESPETVISSLSPCPEKMWEPQADEDDKERTPQQEDPAENVNLSRGVNESLKNDNAQAEETSQDEIDDFEDGNDETDEEEREGKKVLLAEFSLLMKEIENKSRGKKTKTPVFKARNSVPKMQPRKVNLS